MEQHIPEIPSTKLTARSQSALKTPRNFKKFIVKIRPRDPQSNNNSPSIKKGPIYTIAKRFYPNQNDAMPIPGSIEDDILNPEQFLEPHKITARSSQNTPFRDEKQWVQLKPTDVFEKAVVYSKKKNGIHFEDEEDSRKEQVPGRRNTLKYSTRSGDKSSSRDVAKFMRRHTRKLEIDDEEIMIKYNEVRTRLMQQTIVSYNQTTTLMKKAGSVADLNATRQERFFDTYNKTQFGWTKHIMQNCSKLGRPPEMSVVSRAEGYREKVEKARASEMLNPSALIFGAQGWQLSLRGGALGNAHFALPVGNAYTGLWMQVTETPHKMLEIVRTPSNGINGKKKLRKDFNMSPSMRQRMESKRITEIYPVKDDNLGSLIVFFIKGDNL